MTVTAPPPPAPTPPDRPRPAPLPPVPPRRSPRPVRRWSVQPGAPSPRRLAVLGVAWLAATVAVVALVLLALGPLFQQRDQRALLDEVRARIDRAANEALSPRGAPVDPLAPGPGAPVGVLEIGAVQLQQVVVEGSGADQTRAGPGHVPGTAGLGQPGNSVVAGRRTAFGGPFDGVGSLVSGDRILVVTAQGESVYVVSDVREVGIGEGTAEELTGPTDGDQLTLITSATPWPWSSGSATVVVADLAGTPYAPTPQDGRTGTDLPWSFDLGAWPVVLLALLAYVGVGVGAVVLYRRSTPRVAYLLTAGPFLVACVLLAEAVSLVLPAWT